MAMAITNANINLNIKRHVDDKMCNIRRLNRKYRTNLHQVQRLKEW